MVCGVAGLIADNHVAHAPFIGEGDLVVVGVGGGGLTGQHRANLDALGRLDGDGIDGGLHMERTIGATVIGIVTIAIITGFVARLNAIATGCDSAIGIAPIAIDVIGVVTGLAARLDAVTTGRNGTIGVAPVPVGVIAVIAGFTLHGMTIATPVLDRGLDGF